MDLQEMQSVVLTLGNGQIWLETPPAVLQFILVFFHFVVCNCLFARKAFVLILTLGNDRMLLTICVFEKFLFSSGNLVA